MQLFQLANFYLGPSRDIVLAIASLAASFAPSGPAAMMIVAGAMAEVVVPLWLPDAVRKLGAPAAMVPMPVLIPGIVCVPVLALGVPLLPLTSDAAPLSAPTPDIPAEIPIWLAL